MKERVTLTTGVENEIKKKVYKTFASLNEDAAAHDGSTAINLWGNRYDSKDAFLTLSGFLKSEVNKGLSIKTAKATKTFHYRYAIS
jgi:hypothetical protein